MWKLKNRLFGWDYILWKNLADAGIARVLVGVLILLCTFEISVATGFALIIGLCIGSLGQKLGWWDNKKYFN